MNTANATDYRKESEKPALVSGNTLSGLLFYAVNRLGEKEKNNLIMKVCGVKNGEDGKFLDTETLDAEVRDVYFDKGAPRNIWPTKDYSYGAFSKFLDALVEKQGKKVLDNLGYLAADIDMAGKYHHYTYESYSGSELKRKIRTIIEATPLIWTNMYKKGQMVLEETVEGLEARGRLMAFPEMTENNAYLVTKWIERVAQVMTGKEAKVELTYYQPGGPQRKREFVDFEITLKINPQKDVDLRQYNVLVKQMQEEGKRKKPDVQNL